MTTNYQYISDHKGKTKAVIVPVKEFNKMQESLEEFEAIKEYDQAKSEKLTFQPLEEVLREVEAKKMIN